MTAEPLTTARQRLVPGQAGEGGYCALAPADGEQHAVRDDVGIVGTYRAQELFTCQVAAAMVRAVREIRAAPLSGAPIDLAVVTGEVEDERYWHPDGGEPDLPRSRYGFPGVPGVLTAMRRPFRTPGIGVP